MQTIEHSIKNESSPAISITFRRGTIEDSFIVFKIFEQSILDLSERLGTPAISGGQSPETMAQLWDHRRPLFEHLARTAEHFWLAEQDGQVIGYARTILRDGLQELTEFFVLPGQQSSGVGGELLKRAFPMEGAKHRALIATIDPRALVRYLKAGVYPRFASSYFSRPPQKMTVSSDLVFEPVSTSPKTLAAFESLDMILLNHRRDVEHEWLLQNRQGFLYRRDGQPVGYGFIGASNGPFALLNQNDFPAVLAHAEAEAATRNDDFGVEVPLINRVAVDYLLTRGFKMDAFITLFMSDVPFGKFENYIFPSPPFFL